MARGRLKAVVVLAVVGFAMSGVLTYLHLRAVADPRGYRSFCNISPGVNCDAVAVSRYAVVLGVPNSVYGALFYVAVAAIAAFGVGRTRDTVVRVAGHLFLFSSGALLYSLYLGGISYFRLKTLCVLCSALYAVNLALFLVAGSLAGGSPVSLVRHLIADFAAAVRSRVAVSAVCVGVSLASLGVFAVLDVQARRAAAQRFLFEYKDLAPVRIPRLRGVSFGPERAPVTIVEYFDYGCPLCREVHRVLKSLLRRYPTEVRVLFKDYPQCYDCYESEDGRKLPVPCIVPLVARYAHTEGKWWEATEVLFRAHNRLDRWEDVLVVAAEAGLDTTRLVAALTQGDLLAELRMDIHEARWLGIEEIPTFVLNGRILPVVPGPHMLDALVDYEMAQSIAHKLEQGGGSAP